MNLRKFDTINIVPFIDIILVLLVIVLTTATFISKGMIPVDLSKTNSSSKLKKVDTLTITIKKNSDTYFNNILIEKTKLENKILTYKKDITIQLNCDKNSKFDNFIFILNILKKHKFKNLSIITKYEK